MSRRIWEAAELRFNEHRSAALIMELLENQGFTIERGLGGIDTAFSASFGKGTPVIGILGEYDALSGMSQKADVFKMDPIVEGGNGHGCGHNLLGTGAVGAALAVKEMMEKQNLEGTIVMFGCPAEEGGSGKAFMARSGAFDNLDAALSWHPGTAHAVLTGRFMANIQVEFRFTGISSHAASSPHLGRSALDAVELMNVGGNYLREHTDSSSCFHYAVTNTGGTSPNVVQANASVIYLIRSESVEKAKALYKRIEKVAQGAALMTETEVEIKFQKACSNVISNAVLEDLLHKNFQKAGAPEYTDEERAYASRFIETLTEDEKKSDTFMQFFASQPNAKPLIEKLQKEPICPLVLPHRHLDFLISGSSDVGDVSQIVPTAQIITACEAKGTPIHSWQMVAQGTSSIALKGTMKAAEVLGMSALDLLTDKELLKSAKENFLNDTGGKPYSSPIPKNVMPNSL